MQARLHNEMQIEMQVTRGLLHNITLSATRLHATIQTTSALIGQFGSLISNLGSVTSWIWPTISIFVILFVLYQVSPRYAGCALGGIGQSPLNISAFATNNNFAATFSLLKVYGVFELLNSIPTNADFARPALQYDAQILPFLIGAAVLLIVLVIAIVCRFTNILKSLRPRKLDISSDLPCLDIEKMDWKHRPSLI